MQEKLRAYLCRLRTPPFDTAVCGHRGASALAPENTVSAFIGAVEAGCDLVELDVLRTRDEQLVVIHDEKLDRTTNRAGKVSALTLEEIRDCDAGTWFTESFAGERIPTLEEALAVIGHRAMSMIEVKESVRDHPALVDAVVERLRAEGLDDRCVLIVWDAETAAAAREAAPEALLALVTFTRRGMRKAAALGLDGIVCYARSTTRRLIEDAHQAGLFVAPWTLNDPEDMEAFVDAGIDVLVSDLPHLATDVLERRELERTRRLLQGSDGARPA